MPDCAGWIPPRDLGGGDLWSDALPGGPEYLQSQAHEINQKVCEETNRETV